MQLDYQKLYQEAYAQNREKVLDEFKEGALDKKIERFALLHGFSRKQICDALRTSALFRATFAKNPNKQNFFEKVAAEFIESIVGVEAFVNLPNNRLAVMNGGVFDYGDVRDKGVSANAKTIDFQWTFNGYQCYATHKYTAESGGSQDSAYKDVKAFIEAANPCSLATTRFFAIADGDYYNLINSVPRVTRIERLNQLANNSKVFACTINELQPLLKRVC